MQVEELQRWMRGGLVARVVVFQVAPARQTGRRRGCEDWQIWAYGDIPEHRGNRLYFGRAALTFDNADQASGWLRDQGWVGAIEIDGPRATA